MRIDESQVKGLLQEYGIDNLLVPATFKDIALKPASWEIWFAIDAFSHIVERDEIDDLITDQTLELVKLIQFLRKCKNGCLELTGTITQPNKDEIKGTEVHMKLTGHSIRVLELCVDTRLEVDQASLLHDGLDIEPKGLLIGETLPITEPHTDEELERVEDILCAVPKGKKRHTKNGKLGQLANDIDAVFKRHEGYKDMTSTKKYSFIYDLMLMAGFTGKAGHIGKGFIGDIGREKAQYIRNWLKAFQSREKG